MCDLKGGYATRGTTTRKSEEQMKDEIGETAGKVWQALREHGTSDLGRLTKQVHESEKIVLLALGWLARENKVEIRSKKSTIMISLNE